MQPLAATQSADCEPAPAVPWTHAPWPCVVDLVLPPPMPTPHPTCPSACPPTQPACSWSCVLMEDVSRFGAADGLLHLTYTPPNARPGHLGATSATFRCQGAADAHQELRAAAAERRLAGLGAPRDLGSCIPLPRPAWRGGESLAARGMLACLPACSPACLPARLPACSPACLPLGRRPAFQPQQ
jgi:hypothetical protein